MTDKTTDPHTYSFDVSEHLKGSIGDVSATLGERSFSELNDLHAAEGKGEKRTGMLAAFDGEMKARGSVADTALEAANLAAERAGRGAYVSAADHESATAKLQKQVEALTAERDQLKAKAAGKPKPGKAVKTQEPRALAFDGETKLEDGVTVAFGDAQGITNPGIPDLQFGKGDFAKRDGGMVLTQDIRFDGNEPSSDVSAAYLLDAKGKVVGVSRFRQPVGIGGGRQAEFRANTLAFRREDDAPAPDSAVPEAETAGAR